MVVIMVYGIIAELIIYLQIIILVGVKMTDDSILVEIIKKEDPVIVDIITQYITREILNEFYSEVMYCYMARKRFSIGDYDKIEQKYKGRGWYRER